MPDNDLIAIPKDIRRAGRKPKPNPFMEVARLLNDNRDKAKPFDILVAKGEKPEDCINAFKRNFRNAGEALDCTFRVYTPDADKPLSVIVWAIDRIKRPRKNSDSAE